MAFAGHGYALWGDLKYGPDFRHFDYVNPDAPKGGELRLVSNVRSSTFDKYNPFTLRGSAPAYLSGMLFDTLLAGSADELGSAYGLLAEDVEVPADRLSATFRLRPEARFHNGDPVLAKDVKHSFETLLGPHTSPGYKFIYQDVASLEVVDDRTVRFHFKKPNRELPLTVGGLPVFSHKWGDEIDPETGERKTFDKVVMDIPIGSGAYKIGPVRFGKDITYVRDPDYWGRDLPMNVGANNFDRVTVKIYKDSTTKLEALKAGEIDWMRFFSAGDWARRVEGKRFDSGELVKQEFQHSLPAGFQSYFLNTRRPPLDDRNVRMALDLALDYEWMNRRLFYGSYTRVRSLFGNTPCEAKAMPDSAQVELMKAYGDQIPSDARGPAYEAPRTDGNRSLRQNLLEARELLARSGWKIQDGVLRNAQGKAMELEMLESGEGRIRTITPWIRALEKLGIRLNFRQVDFALYQQRLRTFDYDIVSLAFGGTANPGIEYLDLFGSKAASTEDSSNFSGMSSKAVDGLINTMVQAETKDDYLAACRALDRTIMHSHVLVPAWYASTHRVAYDQTRLATPTAMPPYAQAESWAIGNWWARQP
ncbi:extracellular solute-binding protein [Hydrogenophaga sp. 5NK40-0174]|uniref:extracellular solute-binding protein n=1 Tax=Hydrogenophaga sp. 5NK40-0174 TaxID=3127649 RepID=UPI00333ED486